MYRKPNYGKLIELRSLLIVVMKNHVLRCNHLDLYSNAILFKAFFNQKDERSVVQLFALVSSRMYSYSREQVRRGLLCPFSNKLSVYIPPITHSAVRILWLERLRQLPVICDCKRHRRSCVKIMCNRVRRDLDERFTFQASDNSAI